MFSEERIEEAQTAVTAFQRDLAYLAVPFAQQLAGFEQAQIGLAHPRGLAKLFPEQAVEMPRAATAQPSKLFGRVLNEFNIGHLSDNLLESSLGAGTGPGRRMPRASAFTE